MIIRELINELKEYNPNANVNIGLKDYFDSDEINISFQVDDIDEVDTVKLKKKTNNVWLNGG